MTSSIYFFKSALFGKSKGYVGYTRSLTLSIFTVFDLNATDSAAILSSLDFVDLDHSQIISIDDFTDCFCADRGTLFVKIWSQYNQLLQIFSSGRYRNSFAVPSSSSKGQLSATTFELLQFLFLFLSLPDKDVSKLIYWMWYFVTKQSPTVDNLQSLVDDLWEDSGKVGKRKATAKAAIRKSLQIFNMEEMNANKFQQYDWRFNGCWSDNVKTLRVMIKSKLMGIPFWKRISEKCLAVYELKYKFIKPIMRKVYTKSQRRDRSKASYRENGDSKIAKLQLKQYFKLIRTYFEMPGDVNEFEGGANVFVALFEALKNRLRMSMGLPPKISFEESCKETEISASLHSSPKSSNVDRKYFLPPEEEYVSIDTLYESALHKPIEELVDNARLALTHAEDYLARAKKELEIDFNENALFQESEAKEQLRDKERNDSTDDENDASEISSKSSYSDIDSDHEIGDVP